jgi:hypothetical protein
VYIISSFSLLCFKDYDFKKNLQNEIEQSRTWLDQENEESTYKRDLHKRIEFINWILENMKDPDIYICVLIESKMNNVIEIINGTDSILEADNCIA